MTPPPDQLPAIPHTLHAQLAALQAKHDALQQQLHVERVGRLLAEKRLSSAAQGVPSRYARNLPATHPAPKP